MPFPVIPVYPLAFLNNMFGVDGLVVLVIGLLIFGRRLPNVGTDLLRTIREARGETDPAIFFMVIGLTLIAPLLLVYLVIHRTY